jgi:glycosyltransferase involved in cell wall biosynthesis
VLEALAAGLPVLVPETGSTREFINDIAVNGAGDSFILKIPSRIGRHANGMMQNVLELSDIVSLLANRRDALQAMKLARYQMYPPMRRYIDDQHSWYRAAERLVTYLRGIVDSEKTDPA